MSQSQVTNLDVETQTPDRKTTAKTQKRRRCCFITFGVILVTIFLLFVLALIFALTVFKVQDIKTNLVSASFEGVSPRITFPIIQLKLNITLHLQISINNQNYASFRHDAGQSYLLYEGVQVGEAVIDPGFIKARGSTLIEYRLKLQVDELAGEVDKLLRDVVDGELVLVAQSRVPGRVNLMGIVKRNATAFSECELRIDVLGLQVTSQSCKQRTQL